MGTGHRHAALTVGSRALGAFEPRQIRKEAAGIRPVVQEAGKEAVDDLSCDILVAPLQ